MKTDLICQCCGETGADESDSHLGEVCGPCEHSLSHLERFLASPVLRLRKPSVREIFLGIIPDN